MNYIFCGSYNGLLFALYIKNLGEEITVLSYNKNIIKYCKNENIKVIDFKKRPKTPHKSLIKLIRFKKILDKTIKKIDFKKDDKFFITGNMALGYDPFYLAKKLSKKGVCFYKYTDKKFKIFKSTKLKNIYFRGILLKIVIKMIFNLDIIFYETNKEPRLGVNINFMKKYDIKEYNPDDPFEQLILDTIKKTKINYKEFDNMIIDQGLPKGIIKHNSLVNFYKKLFGLPIEFALKKHPDALRPTLSKEETKF